jgi:hemoglobin/transferrin/lactoferrin receptor protein
MTRIISLCTLVLWCAGLHAQVLTLKNKETGQPIEMATLTSESPRAFETTNAKGQANVSAFAGAEAITIRMLGYATTTVSYAQLKADNFDYTLAQEGLSLDQVVVSATRWNQSNRDVPEHFVSISPKDVALQSPQTAADMLGTTGQVLIQKSQLGGGSPMIRGFATNRLLIAVDGVRMNTAIFRSGNVQNIISIDPFAVERAEVLFGPGSVMYGSDAIGGVMSFQTLKPLLSLTDKPVVGGSATGRYSSAGQEFTGHLDVNVGWKKWALLTSITHSAFGNLRMGSHGPTDYLRPTYVQRQDSIDIVVANDDPLVQRPTAYQQTNVMQKIRFSPNAKWDINYGFHYSTTGDYARYDRHLRTRNGVQRSAEWNYGPQVWMMNTLSVAHTDTTVIYDHLVVRLAHQLFEESRMDRNFNGATRYVRSEQVQAYSLNVDLGKNIGKHHQVLYGIEGVFNDVTSTGVDQNIVTGTDTIGPSRYPKSNWASMGVYLTYRYKLSEKLTVQAGARYNHYLLNATFDTSFYPFPFTTAKLNNGALTGSLGAVYNPNQSWALRVNLSTGFRSPNVDDLGKVFESEPGFVVVPNPNLQAEYAYNAELGIAKVFGRWVKLDVTGYYTFLDDALVRRNFTLNGQDSIVYAGETSRVEAIQNAASAWVVGVQAGIEINFTKGFMLSSRINYQQGMEELEDGTTSPLRHAGPWFGSSHLTYSYQKLKLDLYANYNGEVAFNDLALEEQNKPELYAKDADGNPYSPLWYTLNLKAMYEVNQHIQVSGGIENITDQRYRPYSSGIAAAGLNFILSLKAMF